jgi:hypothetical protein
MSFFSYLLSALRNHFRLQNRSAASTQCASVTDWSYSPKRSPVLVLDGDVNPGDNPAHAQDVGNFTPRSEILEIRR